MSSSPNRRLRRKMDQDIKKGIKTPGNKLKIPTEEEIEEYINNKRKELRNGTIKS